MDLTKIDLNKLTRDDVIKQIDDDSAQILSDARRAWQQLQDTERVVQEQIDRANEYYNAKEEMVRLQAIIDNFEG